MRQTPTSPNPYLPVDVDRGKDAVGKAIADHIRRTGITAAEASRRYKGIRANDFRNILNEDHRLYGFSRLVAIAESLGLRVDVQVSA